MVLCTTYLYTSSELSLELRAKALNRIPKVRMRLFDGSGSDYVHLCRWEEQQ